MPRYTRNDAVEAAVDAAARRIDRIEWVKIEADAYERLNDQLERKLALQAAIRTPTVGRSRLRLVATDNGAA